ncbi:hypothetical protein, partial [Flavobacterium agri]|uniref:hypothetical protein n=1 Tax=Flavobacterium agri TaxID=2743471 RepID=UPI001C37D1E1
VKDALLASRPHAQFRFDLKKEKTEISKETFSDFFFCGAIHSQILLSLQNSISISLRKTNFQRQICF